MSLHAQLHRPALRATVSVTLLAGVVTSVIAAYQGYQALAPRVEPAVVRGGGSVADGLETPAGSRASAQVAVTVPVADNPGPAVQTRTPETGWSAGPVRAWGPTPVVMPQPPPTAGWRAAPVASMPASPGAAGGWPTATPPWAWGRAPASTQPAVSPWPGPGRVGGKACGMGFG